MHHHVTTYNSTELRYSEFLSDNFFHLEVKPKAHRVSEKGVFLS